MLLRPYQRLAVEMLRERVKDRPLLCMATGSGKTPVLAEVVRLAHEKGRSTLLLVDRRELVEQAADKKMKGDERKSFMSSCLKG